MNKPPNSPREQMPPVWLANGLAMLARPRRPDGKLMLVKRCAKQNPLQFPNLMSSRRLEASKLGAARLYKVRMSDESLRTLCTVTWQVYEHGHICILTFKNRRAYIPDFHSKIGNSCASCINNPTGWSVDYPVNAIHQLNLQLYYT